MRLLRVRLTRQLRCAGEENEKQGRSMPAEIASELDRRRHTAEKSPYESYRPAERASQGRRTGVPNATRYGRKITREANAIRCVVLSMFKWVRLGGDVDFAVWAKISPVLTT